MERTSKRDAVRAYLLGKSIVGALAGLLAFVDEEDKNQIRLWGKQVNELTSRYGKRVERL